MSFTVVFGAVTRFRRTGGRRIRVAAVHSIERDGAALVKEEAWIVARATSARNDFSSVLLLEIVIEHEYEHDLSLA
jgi:hypothetical protein